MCLKKIIAIIIILKYCKADLICYDCWSCVSVGYNEEKNCPKDSTFCLALYVKVAWEPEKVEEDISRRCMTAPPEVDWINYQNTTCTGFNVTIYDFQDCRVRVCQTSLCNGWSMDEMTEDGPIFFGPTVSYTSSISSKIQSNVVLIYYTSVIVTYVFLSCV